MKMKNLLGILMLIALVGMAINLSSCSKDDEYSIVGSWKVTVLTVKWLSTTKFTASSGDGESITFTKQ